MIFDINKSLEELEGTRWEESEFQTGLINRCQELRKKKLKDFTTEDLRVMIGQNISLNYLVPLALQKLVTNPFAQGDFYHGDLFVQVLRVDKDFWNQNWHLLSELSSIIALVKSTIDTINPIIKDSELSS